MRQAGTRSTLRARPIVTLTTDFGLSDFYVAAMKAVLVGRCQNVRMIDVTHSVPRHDILCGSITLERAVDGFPPGTVHLAVVDPGVGTARRLIVTKVADQLIVSPDNGLITWPARMHPPARAHEITWRPQRVASSTFHGRDILAPVAGMLAEGAKLASITRPIDDPVLLDVAPVEEKASQGRIIHIDHFGNATTNVRMESLPRGPKAAFSVKRRRVGRLKRTYSDVAPGEPIALIGSSGLLEIAVRDGSAAQKLKLKVGDTVKIS